jgi:hypothetical protein
MIVRVLSIPFRVRIVPPERLDGAYGRTSARAQLIELAADQPPANMRDSLLHEVLHACFAQTSLASDRSWERREEQVVRALTPVLLQVLRSNPKLVRALLE